jgi:hypothetical protein
MWPSDVQAQSPVFKPQFHQKKKKKKRKRKKKAHISKIELTRTREAFTVWFVLTNCFRPSGK